MQSGHILTTLESAHGTVVVINHHCHHHHYQQQQQTFSFHFVTKTSTALWVLKSPNFLAALLLSSNDCWANNVGRHSTPKWSRFLALSTTSATFLVHDSITVRRFNFPAAEISCRTSISLSVKPCCSAYYKLRDKTCILIAKRLGLQIIFKHQKTTGLLSEAHICKTQHFGKNKL